MFGRVFKMIRWNKDPTQQHLALLLIRAGSGTAHQAVPIAHEIKALVNRNGWDRAEAADRIAHALSMVRVMEPGAVFENATEVGLSISRGEI